MDELAKFLEENQIDASTLNLLYNTDMGSIYYLTISEDDYLEKWKKLRDLVEWTGRWPVILEGGKSRWEQDENDFYVYPTKYFIEEALTFDVSSWFIEKWEESRAAVLDEEGTDIEEAIRELPHQHKPKRKDQRISKNTYRTSLTKRSVERPKEDYLLALLPTEISWYAPVLLVFGAFNDCPLAEVHAAVLKYWNERYGAEIQYMEHSIIGLSVARPVQEWEQAVELAKEQYVYCSDSWRPAVQLIGATSWSFWWD